MPFGQWTKPVFFVAAALYALGQESNVVICIPSFDWVSYCIVETQYSRFSDNLIIEFDSQTINSKGQTPCLVAAFLYSQCGIREFTSCCVFKEFILFNPMIMKFK